MVKNTIGALEITTAVVLNTTECMLIIRLVTTMSGDPKWTNVTLPGIKARNLTRHRLNLQMIQTESLPSTTSFTVAFVLRLAFLLKQSIGSGKMLKETRRSESRVE
jgi:hypothetical protein